jgi:hypothetical protein
VDALLEAIQQSSPAAALRGSFFVYPVVNALHILAIGALVTSVGMMDLRVLGAFRALPEEPFVRLMRRVAIAAFAVAVATGLLLFAVRATEYGTMPLFWIKLGLIGVAGANAVAFGLVRHTGMRRGLAVLSIGLWLAAVLAGRFLGFV